MTENQKDAAKKSITPNRQATKARDLSSTVQNTAKLATP
jgi:hypothetical protein